MRTRAVVVFGLACVGVAALEVFRWWACRGGLPFLVNVAVDVALGVVFQAARFHARPWP